MKIGIFSVADRRSRSGNWVTAQRWQSLLRSAGHRVSILHNEDRASRTHHDLLIGLHARRSSKALLQFRDRYPESHTMVALTGTDLYQDLAATQKRQPKLAIRSLDRCEGIILLQPLMQKKLLSRWKAKSSVVMMDAIDRGKPRSRTLTDSTMSACVVGHMRYEKDPLRAAMAVRKLPANISIEVTHAGKALDDSFQQRADTEDSQNPNWNWVGSINRSQVDQLMQQSDLLINSSRTEGAPNVLFEAIGYRLPMLVTKIDGHVGVLGTDYPGYFPVGKTESLRRLLLRCLDDKAFYRSLISHVDDLAAKYACGTELNSLLAAIQSIT